MYLYTDGLIPRFERHQPATLTATVLATVFDARCLRGTSRTRARLLLHRAEAVDQPDPSEHARKHAGTQMAAATGAPRSQGLLSLLPYTVDWRRPAEICPAPGAGTPVCPRAFTAAGHHMLPSARDAVCSIQVSNHGLLDRSQYSVDGCHSVDLPSIDALILQHARHPPHHGPPPERKGTCRAQLFLCLSNTPRANGSPSRVTGPWVRRRTSRSTKSASGSMAASTSAITVCALRHTSRNHLILFQAMPARCCRPASWAPSCWWAYTRTKPFSRTRARR
jgi:hypothetical protein